MVIQTKMCNASNYGGKRATTRYIVVHYTSNRGDTAQDNAEYFAREAVSASAHYFVDEQAIWASVPEDCVAYHCGAKTYRHTECRNANSLGVEVCMNDASGGIRQESMDHAAQLVRELMKKYNIPVERVLRHYDVTGKCCPEPMVSNLDLWKAFKETLIEDEVEEMWYTYYEQMPDWAKPTVSKLVKKGYLKGEGNGVLNLTEETLKVLVINDRAGCYGA